MDERFETIQSLICNRCILPIEVPSMDERFETNSYLPSKIFVFIDRGAFNG